MNMFPPVNSLYQAIEYLILLLLLTHTNAVPFESQCSTFQQLSTHIKLINPQNFRLQGQACIPFPKLVKLRVALKFTQTIEKINIPQIREPQS